MPTLQLITLTLDGVTNDDYLAHVRDPEPPALGLGALVSVTVRPLPLGDTVEAALMWDGVVPPAERAAALAGLPITADVVDCTARMLSPLELRRVCPEVAVLAQAA